MKQFSETYYPFPKTEQWKHEKNNQWFKKSLETLKDKQLLIIEDIPFGPKYFNKEEMANLLRESYEFDQKMIHEKYMKLIETMS